MASSVNVSDSDINIHTYTLQPSHCAFNSFTHSSITVHCINLTLSPTCKSTKYPRVMLACVCEKLQTGAWYSGNKWAGSEVAVINHHFHCDENVLFKNMIQAWKIYSCTINLGPEFAPYCCSSSIMGSTSSMLSSISVNNQTARYYTNLI